MNVRVGGLELGGTKTVVAIGTADGAVMEEFRYPTTNPEETLTIAAEWWRQRGPLAKIGIAAFGPIRLQRHACDFGTLLRTPKTAWQGFSLAKFFRERFPESLLCIDTDVNAALLGELQCGAARGMRNVIYVTVGTGIGAGIFCEGNLVYGTLHPEFGHLRVPRHRDDSFVGACPFHRDCLEGLASGLAMEQRWGLAGNLLPLHHAAWEMEAWYLAQGIYSACTLLTPEIILLGGGVSQQEGLHDRVAALLDDLGNGYFETYASRIKRPALDQQAGIVGALLLS
jgi:fructokinase